MPSSCKRLSVFQIRAAQEDLEAKLLEQMTQRLLASEKQLREELKQKVLHNGGCASVYIRPAIMHSIVMAFPTEKGESGQ